MWLSHKYTYVPSFSAPRPPTPQGCHRAPGWAPVTKQLLTAICLHMVMSTFQCYSFNSSHPINIFINKYVYIFVSLPTTFLDKLIHVIYTFQSSPRDCRRRERQFNDTQRKHQVVKKKNHWSCCGNLESASHGFHTKKEALHETQAGTEKRLEAVQHHARVCAPAAISEHLRGPLSGSKILWC